MALIKRRGINLISQALSLLLLSSLIMLKVSPLGSCPTCRCTTSQPMSFSVSAYVNGLLHDCRQNGILLSPLLCLTTRTILHFTRIQHLNAFECSGKCAFSVSPAKMSHLCPSTVHTDIPQTFGLNLVNCGM